MNPWQLAGDSESSQQIALFCWAAKAQRYGFQVADNQNCYKGALLPSDIDDTIPELAWLHHIPNGGSRGDTQRSRQIAGGQLKAEGVKSGVMDIFWPLARDSRNGYPDGSDRAFCGLYIEMKRPSLKGTKGGGLSAEQVEFGNFVHNQGFHVVVCYDWLEAKEEIKKYFLQSA